MDFVPLCKEISAEQGGPGGLTSVTMHDGSIVRFRKTDADYNATDRIAAYSHVKACIDKGEVATGLLYLEEGARGEMHTLNKTVQAPLMDVPYAELCPGNKQLIELMEEYRLGAARELTVALDTTGPPVMERRPDAKAS